MSEPNEVQETDPVVDSNLRIIEEQMPRLLSSESVGGNAGRIEIGGKKYSCAGANVHIDKQTGEIRQFGNIQDIPPDIRDNRRNIRGTLRVVCNHTEGKDGDGHGIFSPIVSFSTQSEIGITAKEKILKAAYRYNQKYAPQLPVNLFEEEI